MNFPFHHGIMNLAQGPEASDKWCKDNWYLISDQVSIDGCGCSNFLMHLLVQNFLRSRLKLCAEFLRMKSTGERRVHTMDDHVFLTVLALIISAVFERNLLETVAIVEVTYSIVRLLRYCYISRSEARRRHRKSPSSSAKRDGRLRNRS